jgi:hypothetical protein
MKRVGSPAKLDFAEIPELKQPWHTYDKPTNPWARVTELLPDENEAEAIAGIQRANALSKECLMKVGWSGRREGVVTATLPGSWAAVVTEKGWESRCPYPMGV